MTFPMLKAVEPGSPSETDRAEAVAASRALALLNGRGGVRVEAVTGEGQSQTFILPAPAVRLLTDMMAYLAAGRMVQVMPEDAELTTQEAADMLNVSRPHLVKLIQEGRLRHHKAGTHRRVLLRDLLEYRRKRQDEANAAMDELAAQAQELGMGY